MIIYFLSPTGSPLFGPDLILLGSVYSHSWHLMPVSLALP